MADALQFFGYDVKGMAEKIVSENYPGWAVVVGAKGGLLLTPPGAGSKRLGLVGMRAKTMTQPARLTIHGSGTDGRTRAFAKPVGSKGYATFAARLNQALIVGIAFLVQDFGKNAKVRALTNDMLEALRKGLPHALVETDVADMHTITKLGRHLVVYTQDMHVGPGDVSTIRLELKHSIRHQLAMSGQGKPFFQPAQMHAINALLDAVREFDHAFCDHLNRTQGEYGTRCNRCGCIC